MKVAFILASHGVGGAEKRTFKTCLAIARQKPDWTVLLLSYGSTLRWFRRMLPFYGEQPRNLIFRAIPVSRHVGRLFRLEAQYLKTRLLSRALAWYWRIAIQGLLREGFDRFQVSYGPYGVDAALAAANGGGNRFIVEVTGQGNVSYIGDLVEVSQPRCPVSLVCVSPAVEARLRDRLQTTHPNVGIACFPGPGFITLSAGKEGDVGARQPLVLFPHRLAQERKNTMLFARCVKALVAQGLSGWRFHLCGTLGSESPIRQFLQPEIQAGIVQIGRVEQLEQLATQASIAVSVIATGSYPSQSMYECLAAGCLAVIAPVQERDQLFAGDGTFFCEMTEEGICAALGDAMRVAEDETLAEEARAGAIATAERLARESGYLDAVIQHLTG